LGLEYLLTKSMMQASSALNVAAYLLLKAEHAQKEKEAGDSFFEVDSSAAIKSHPVIARLQQLNKLGMKLENTVESKIEGIDEQIDSLVKAAALMKNDGASDDDDDDDDDDSEDPDLASESDGDEVAQKKTHLAVPSSFDKSDQEIAHGVLNEARFGLRVKEISAKAVPQQRRPAPSDFGDEVDDSSKARKASQALASTINAIQQRSSAKARKSSRYDEDLDKQGGDDDRVSRGIAMMEAELGPLDDDEDEDVGSGGDDHDDELDDDLGTGSFYDQIKKKSQVQKAFKKQLHAVAPKFPVMEGVVDGERAISKVILKNRGLVAHKAKINRNPRVKKREQFRKALIRQRGKIREVRTEEGHKYGGEGTGIKTGLSRSRKLGTS
jgi:U3 small nucleolar RNA-associated protein 3